MKQVGIGIIGCGVMGSAHMQAAVKSSVCKLAALADIRFDVAREKAKTLNITSVYSNTDALWIGDCPASFRFISLKMYQEFAFEPAKALISELKRADCLVFYFTAEKDPAYLQAMAELGNDVLGLSEEADIFGAKDVVGSSVCIMGNVDPIHLLRDSTPAEIAAHTRRIKEEVNCTSGHIFNTGEGITPDTHRENVRAMAQSI